MTLRNACLLLLLCCLAPIAAGAREGVEFAGDYGHGATARPDDVVWSVRPQADRWRLVAHGDGAAEDARRLGPAARAAFWNAMHWPADTAQAADCLGWGARPASLTDLLAEGESRPAPADDYGYGLLCHVPAPARARIDWLAGNAGDWFYYDPVAGVMEAKPLR